MSTWRGREVIQEFGNKNGPINYRLGFHPGLDLKYDEGEHMEALADGVVRFRPDNGGGYGNVGYIVMNNGDVLWDAHLKAGGILVKEGTRVRQGQKVFVCGSTGKTSGPHRHVEYRLKGSEDLPVDIRKKLPAVQSRPTPKPAPKPQPAPQEIGPPNYDGVSITVQRGWGVSHAAKAAGFPDFKSKDRWNLIAKLNGRPNYKYFSVHPGQRIKVGRYVPPVKKKQPKPVAPNYDGARITLLPGWGISQAMKAADYPEEIYSQEQPDIWTAISKKNGFDNYKTFNANLRPGQRIWIGSYEHFKPKPGGEIQAKSPEVGTITADLPSAEGTTVIVDDEPYNENDDLLDMKLDDEEDSNLFAEIDELQKNARSNIRQRFIQLINAVYNFFYKIKNKKETR